MTEPNRSREEGKAAERDSPVVHNERVAHSDPRRLHRVTGTILEFEKKQRGERSAKGKEKGELEREKSCLHGSFRYRNLREARGKREMQRSALI